MRNPHTPMSNNPYRWITLPGVSYPEEKKQNPTPRRKRASTPPQNLDFSRPKHKRFLENPTLYSTRGLERKIPLSPPPSEIDWCTAIEAMKILSCSRATVYEIARRYNIRQQDFAKPHTKGNGYTKVCYYKRDEILLVAKLRAIKKNKSRKK